MRTSVLEIRKTKNERTFEQPVREGRENLMRPTTKAKGLQSSALRLKVNFAPTIRKKDKKKKGPLNLLLGVIYSIFFYFGFPGNPLKQEEKKTHQELNYRE